MKAKHSHWQIWVSIIIILLFVIWLHWPREEDEIIYVISEPKEEVVGLYSKNFCGYKGNWIHIRVENDSSYKELISVCIHEASHNLFCEIGNCSDKDYSSVSENYAKVCEKYPRLCLNDEIELQKIISNETN